ncbi:MAG: S24 family peptidase [Alphaproteobacteria bacterium]|nr:S24 family peptidase [Alphaproteobacteria bacterium]
MANLEIIRKRLEKLIINNGYSFREVSLKIGRKDSYIQQYIKYGFPKRLNEIDRKKICLLLNIEEKELIDEDLMQNGATDNTLINATLLTGSPADFVTIDIFAPQANLPQNAMLIGKMALNYKEFFGWFSGNPYNLKMLRLAGDSMEPLFSAGNLVIFDASVLEYAGEGLYIIKFNQQILLRRLQKNKDGSYVIKAENPRYDNITAESNEFEIMGRAINTLATRPI